MKEMTFASSLVWIIVTLRQIQCSVDHVDNQAQVFGQVGVLLENHNLQNFHFDSIIKHEDTRGLQSPFTTSELQQTKAYQLCRELKSARGQQLEIEVDFNTKEMFRIREIGI